MADVKLRSPRNPEIELWRFFFAVVVFLDHMKVFPHASLAVDFFFLLTGYLTMVSIQKAAKEGCTRSCFSFIIHKMKSFYPELLVAMVISIAIIWGVHGVDANIFKQSCNTFINGILPFLKMSGLSMSAKDYNSATWYISSMLIGLVLVYPQLVRYGAHAFLLAVGVLICGFLCAYHGSLDRVYTYLGVTYEGNLRAVGELLIGATIYPLAQYLKSMRPTFLCSVLATLLKCCGVACIVYIASLDNTEKHGIALCAAVMVLVLVVSGYGIDKRLYDNKLCLFLGALSLPFYLGHYTITTQMGALLPVSNAPAELVLPVAFVYSLISALLIMWLGTLIRKLGQKLRMLLIEDAS